MKMCTRSFVVRLVNCVMVSFLVGCSTVRDIYHVAGQYQKQTAQGMTIFNDKAFLANNTGICRIYDLKKFSTISSFQFASAHKSNHCNCLDFGVEYPKKDSFYPTLYISECSGKGRCFVEDVNNGHPVLLQTISFKKRVTNWVVDRENSQLYAVAHLMRANKQTDSMAVYRFPLPAISEGNVDLSDKVEEMFIIHVPYVYQGATIHRNKLYLPVGVNRRNKAIKKDIRKILVVDLRKKGIIRQIDITDKVTNEPEDVSIYRGKLLLFCGQNGGLRKIKY